MNRWRAITFGSVAALLVSAGCSSTGLDDGGPARVDRIQVAGAFLRAVISGHKYDLMFFRIRKPGSFDGKRGCSRDLGPQWYSFNWSAINDSTPVPEVSIGIHSADGAAMTLWLGREEGCQTADSLTLDAMSSGTQLVLGGAFPAGEPIARSLRITIDGHDAKIHLRHTCSNAETMRHYADRKSPCADDPMQFYLGNGYSTRLVIS